MRHNRMLMPMLTLISQTDDIDKTNPAILIITLSSFEKRKTVRIRRRRAAVFGSRRVFPLDAKYIQKGATQWPGE